MTRGAMSMYYVTRWDFPIWVWNEGRFRRGRDSVSNPATLYRNIEKERENLESFKNCNFGTELPNIQVTKWQISRTKVANISHPYEL